jgi:hypothetical protein
MPYRGRGCCAVAAPMPPCPAPWQDRAWWPSLPLPINTEGVQEEKVGAGTFLFERESEGDRERDRQLLERKRGETEGVKHHGRARDRK